MQKLAGILLIIGVVLFRRLAESGKNKLCAKFRESGPWMMSKIPPTLSANLTTFEVVLFHTKNLSVNC